MLTDIKSNRGGTCRPNWTDRQRNKKNIFQKKKSLVINITLDPRQKDRLVKSVCDYRASEYVAQFRSILDDSVDRKEKKS